MPVDLLALLLGKAAPQTREFANDRDDQPVVREAATAKSYSQQETFAADTTNEEFIEATLRRMADELMCKVREDGKSVRTITVKARYNDMAEDQRSESLGELPPAASAVPPPEVRRKQFQRRRRMAP